MASEAAPTEELKNLILDEVTGEKVSKTELKKRQKLREKDARKAEKAAAAPQQPTPTKRKNAAEDEAQLDPREFFERRSRVIKKMKQDMNPNPYPHKFNVTTDMPTFMKEYESLQKGEEKKDVEVRVGARIYELRSSGANLFFYKVQAQGVRFQVMCQSQNASDPAKFSEQHELLRRGDVIGIVGYPGRTSPKTRDTGDLSVFAREVILLTPCLHMMPPEHQKRVRPGAEGNHVDETEAESTTTERQSGLTDPETRFRKRHFDMIMNKKVRDIFITRGRMIDYIRTYFKDHQFLEVETPMMNQIAGGATAKPFKTFHNAYDQELFMRVAPELYLKQLVVGGLERVFELGKQFRNEDADLTHNPEFTTCEFYQAYADVYDIMETTEDLVSGMVEHVHGSHETTFHTQAGEEYKVNWAKPWKRIEMMPALEEATGETFPPSTELHTQETNDFLRRVIKKVNVECPPPLTNARMIDKLVGEFIEEKCINPTFITGHPQMMSPLAKYHRDIPGLCERFEAFVCKKEIVNAYTELNDPFDQRLRFEEQANQKSQGDDEAQLIDETFCESLEWGLPPTGGWGMGIDRMVMFLTDNYSIREVLTFPFMKQVKTGQKLAAEEVGVKPAEGTEDVPMGSK